MGLWLQENRAQAPGAPSLDYSPAPTSSPGRDPEGKVSTSKVETPPSLGLRSFCLQVLACLSFLSGQEREEGGKRSLRTTCSWEGNPNWDKDGFLGKGEIVMEGRFFAKVELTYLLSRAMHTTTSVCLSVRPPVCAIPNASALPLAAVAAVLAKLLRH